MVYPIKKFLYHVALVQRKREQKTQAIGKIESHISDATKVILSKNTKKEDARTVLDELKDRITSIIIQEKLITNQQKRDEDKVDRLHARIEELEGQLQEQGCQVDDVVKNDHDQFESFHAALRDIEGQLSAETKMLDVVEKKEEKLEIEEDVRAKKIRQVMEVLQRIESEHERLSKKSNADPKQVSRLARMIKRHKNALDQV